MKISTPLLRMARDISPYLGSMARINLNEKRRHGVRIKYFVSRKVSLNQDSRLLHIMQLETSLISYITCCSLGTSTLHLKTVIPKEFPIRSEGWCSPSYGALFQKDLSFK